MCVRGVCVACACACCMHSACACACAGGAALRLCRVAAGPRDLGGGRSRLRGLRHHARRGAHRPRHCLLPPATTCYYLLLLATTTCYYYWLLVLAATCCHLLPLAAACCCLLLLLATTHEGAHLRARISRRRGRPRFRPRLRRAALGGRDVGALEQAPHGNHRLHGVGAGPLHLLWLCLLWLHLLWLHLLECYGHTLTMAGPHPHAAPLRRTARPRAVPRRGVPGSKW